MTIPIYEPLNTLKKVAENIWIVDGGQIKMDVGRFKVPFSTRMTIVRLSDQSLWCHSPIQANEELFQEIDRLGPVKHLISPNKIHYAYIEEWKKRYPDAIAWSSPGVEKRAAKQEIEVHFDDSLKNTAPSYWKDEIEQLIFKGSRAMEEVVFFHKRSHTLILTDLIENFEPQKIESKFWRLIYQFGGIADPDGKTPIDLRLTFLGRKKKAKAAYKQMLSWQPEKIILAHGRWYDKNGTDELKRAFRWLHK
ncbi:DUF4336 domain-containing protein [Tetragenococcus halophilus]|uniref:DUF4336 domain-containing protein n=1 Tax=Tetragenococcus halophilus TaxID=51669 RepID=UPI00256A4284|nr:DUF4336 domain-containing protein [Tetragenococcus halophilus]GMG64368.1 DUF4336 domain-containing protein [Tetragenococcus halophilus]GMG68891.1 DUF4336 domain-containing protein [Tetragenococcus halophilus]